MIAPIPATIIRHAQQAGWPPIRTAGHILRAPMTWRAVVWAADPPRLAAIAKALGEWMARHPPCDEPEDARPAPPLHEAIIVRSGDGGSHEPRPETVIYDDPDDPDMHLVSPVRGTLLDCPHEEPLPRQVWLAERAIAAARAVLDLPEAMTLSWHDGGPAVTYGTAWCEGDSYGIALNTSTPPGELTRTVYHEAQHVADFASGGARLSSAELERRAGAFAARMQEARCV